MRKPDRFERMVEKMDKTAAGFNNHGLVYPLDAVSLLRRQHAAYVRLVEKEMGHRLGMYVMLEDPGGRWISRADLLAAFTRYRKGAR